MSYLKTISRLSAQDNLGGLVKIQVIRKDDVVSIPDPVDGIIYGDIEFQEGAGFVTWDVTLETSKISTDDHSGKEGSSKTNRLPFSVPKNRADIRSMFLKAEDDEFIVLFKDASTGKTRIFGQLEAPVRFRFNHDSGDTFSSGNRYQGEFFYTGPDNIYEYDGTIPAAPPGAAPAIVKWADGTVIATLYPGDILIVDSEFAHEFQLIQAP